MTSQPPTGRAVRGAFRNARGAEMGMARSRRRFGWRSIALIAVAVIAGYVFQSLQPYSAGGERLSAVSSGGGGTWAVGSSCSSCGAPSGTYRTLIMRWRGSSWSTVASPSPGSVSVLRAISSGPDGTAWAVGWTCVSGCQTGAEADRTLILRWNGSAWSRVPSPSPGRAALLYGVSQGPGGAWAVGWSCASRCWSPAGRRALVLRWDGSAWSAVASPSPGGGAVLRAVNAGPGGMAWAAGWYCASSCASSRPAVRTLAMRWNGTAWLVVHSPTPGVTSGLQAISTGPAGTAWAAGWDCVADCGAPAPALRTLILRWNGSGWSRVPSPSLGRTATLYGIQSAPEGTAWAAGSSCIASCGSTSAETDRALILRWNGSAWSPIASPRSGSTFLAGLAVLPDDTAFAVGRTCSANCDTTTESDQPLILQWARFGWSVKSS